MKSLPNYIIKDYITIMSEMLEQINEQPWEKLLSHSWKDQNFSSLSAAYDKKKPETFSVNSEDFLIK